MTEMDISFIIPIYNTPIDLLKNCCDKFRNHSLNINFEVLLIDDGSDDYIGNFLLEYTDKIFFKYYKKENGGVSDARNFGMKKSIGKYVCFVDPDDELDFFWDKSYFDLDQDIYLMNYKKINNKNIAVFQSDLEKMFFNKQLLRSDRLFEAVLKVSEDYFSLDGFYLGTPWGKLFKRNFLITHELRFDLTLRKRQDALFCAQAYLKTTNINILINDGLIYSYRIDNKNSITKNYNTDIKYIYVYLFIKMKELNNQYKLNLDDALSLYSYDLLKELINLDFCNVHNDRSYFKRKASFNSFRNDKKLIGAFKKIPYKKLSISKCGLYICEKHRIFFVINFIFIYRKIFMRIKKL